MSMEERAKPQEVKFSWFYGFLTLLYAAGLCAFYFHYVPFVRSFQLVLLPTAVAAALLTAVNLRWGTLYFIFVFPLINGLPYFFSIYESVPHAPTALVLFLFFFLGWLIRRIWIPTSLFPDHPIIKPIIVFSLLATISAVITIFRFANFFPFLSDYVYELSTNVINTTAGGAIMSSIFYSLNYLSEFAAFFIFLSFFRSRSNLRAGMTAFSTSIVVAIGFGLYQCLCNMALGNTPASAKIHIINATFKDSNSFGAFLAIVIPVWLSFLLAGKTILKVLSAILLALSVILLPYTGSGSGLLGILAGILLIFGMVFAQAVKLRRNNPKAFRRVYISAVVIILCLVLVSLSIITSKESNLFYKIKTKVIDIQAGNSWDNLIHRRWAVNWEGAVDMLKEYPFSGVGVGAYTIEISNYAQLRKKSLPIGQSAENHLLQVASELGLPGLLLALWIFWEILKQMRLTFNKAGGLEGRSLIVLGGLAGMASFFLNLLFHTYIGSYEIKYAFWLIAAFVFSPSGLSLEGVSPKPLSKGFKVRTAAALIIFAGVHMWNSTHALSLKSRTEIFSIDRDFGLYQLEKTIDGRKFRWTRSYGGIPVKIEKPVLVLPLQASHPDIRRKPVQVKIYLVKEFFKFEKLLKEVTLSQNSWQEVMLDVVEYVNHDALLLIKVDRTWCPLKTSGVPDPRDLGVAVGTVRFQDKL